jgi:hypothetical protein
VFREEEEKSSIGTKIKEEGLLVHWLVGWFVILFLEENKAPLCQLHRDRKRPDTISAMLFFFETVWK